MTRCKNDEQMVEKVECGKKGVVVFRRRMLE